MEQGIRERFDEGILDEARLRYGIHPDRLKLLDGFESFIYEFTKNDQHYILRIGHSLRRTAELISAEVEWINYLADGGASVARAIYSENEKLVESIDDGEGGQFLTTAFIRAPGEPPNSENWGPTLFRQYGQLIGRMHALSRNYQPTQPEIRRPEWDDPVMIDLEEWLPKSESQALQRYLELKKYLLKLPKDSCNYGLVHQDAHAGNFFVDHNGHITLFDFDDCAYTWYINDIAIVLFYTLAGRADAAEFVPTFMTPFLEGYVKENQPENSSFLAIPQFLKLREIDLYGVIHRSFDVNNLDNTWVANFMENRKFRIENDIPFVDYDFEQLVDLMF